MRVYDIVGDKNPNWKGGVIKKRGYRLIYQPNHPYADSNGYVRRHRLIMENYFSILFDEPIYIPRYFVVHHIIPVKEGGTDALINLELLTHKNHMRHHMKGNQYGFNRHIDTSNRYCHTCGSNTTQIDKPSKYIKTPHPHWYHLPNDKINFYCQKCYDKDKYLRGKNR